MPTRGAGGGEPGGMAARSHNGRASSGHGSGCSCWGCWTTFPSCRRAPVRPVVAGSKHPEGAPAAIGERFGQAIVRHGGPGHGRDQLADRTVEEADGPPRLTVEATWGPDVGSVHIEFHLRPCIDAKRSNRAGKSLANGDRGAWPWQQARGWTRPVLLEQGEPAPESNRRPQSLPLMLAAYVALHRPLTHATEQVKGAAGDRVVGWREVACSAVSGKSLAGACTAVHGRRRHPPEPSHSRLAPQVQCSPWMISGRAWSDRGGFIRLCNGRSRSETAVEVERRRSGPRWVLLASN